MIRYVVALLLLGVAPAQAQTPPDTTDLLPEMPYASTKSATEPAGASSAPGARAVSTEAAGAAVVHQVPFASADNVIELEVANSTGVQVRQVRITPQEVPAWVEVAPAEHLIEELEAGTSVQVAFRFTLKREAPVGEPFTLAFNAAMPGQQVWTKQVGLEVAPPKQVALLGNYPNPFNPQTAIHYELPETSRVRLVIYDVQGREVARLVEGAQAAGYHEAAWEAPGYASGLYLYRLEVEGERSGLTIKQGQMMLVK